MSLASVRADLSARAPELIVLEADTSTATVALAAAVWNVEPGRIAKTLSLRVGGRVILIVTSGDRRLDNRKLRQTFEAKGRMLDADEVLELTGHPVGGVCPFGLATDLPIYCDESLRDWDVVLPAAGSQRTAVKVPLARLAELTGNRWIDVCQSPAIDDDAGSPT